MHIVKVARAFDDLITFGKECIQAFSSAQSSAQMQQVIVPQTPGSSCPKSQRINVGTAIASGQADDPLLNQRVLLVPMRGWQSDPDAPEDP